MLVNVLFCFEKMPNVEIQEMVSDSYNYHCSTEMH